MRDVRTDDAIGEFLRSPSEESFVPVYASLCSPLSRYFLVRGLDFFAAEELAQDVLLTLYRRSGEVRNGLSITGWLFRVARNTYLQHVRKHRLAVESLTDKNGLEKDFGLAAAQFQPPVESQLFEWIKVLSEDEREICLMRYLDDLEYQAISDALDLPMGTVKWKLHHIKQKLADRIRMTDREPKR